MPKKFPDRFRFVIFKRVTSPKTNYGMEAYHFRSYTILIVLDIFIFVDVEARLRNGFGKDILILSFFWSRGQLLVAERHIHRFDFF